MFGMGTAEDLFSSDWMHREAALMLLARESISYLLPSVTAKFQSRHGRRGDGRHGEECGAVQKVCMAVVVHSCNDVVLKVFLAALVSDCMRVTKFFFFFSKSVNECVF